MVSVKIDDTLFAHDFYSTCFQKSKYINWDRTPVKDTDKLVVYTDNSIKKVNSKVKIKIGWLLESPAITENEHRWVKYANHQFDMIFTHSRELLELNDKFKFLPTGGCWIEQKDQMVYEKSKMTSIIASSKNYTDGHKLRQSIIQKKPSGVDVFGRGHADIDYKLKGLADYRFSIVIENTKKDYYFTEKLIDCFATGTIPIYWGCPSIGNFFKNEGILTFDNLDELNIILANLNSELYESKLDAVVENFNRSKEYIIAEDYMYEKYLRDYVKHV